VPLGKRRRPNGWGGGNGKMRGGGFTILGVFRGGVLERIYRKKPREIYICRIEKKKPHDAEKPSAADLHNFLDEQFRRRSLTKGSLGWGDGEILKLRHHSGGKR